MAENKRTELEREMDYERITSLYLRKHTQSEIAQQLNLSQQQISYDLQVIQRRWREKTIINLDEAKMRELARIDELEREYWRAWIESKSEKTKQRQESKGKGKDGKPIVDKMVMEKDQLLGNSSFLAGVQWCVEMRCKILGLFAPNKNDNSFTPGSEVVFRVLYGGIQNTAS